jgi:uncharacterized protein (DUF427 family)
MSTRMSEALPRLHDELAHEPTEKRVRAMLGEHTVTDTTRAVLVWEPRRVVPAYAVPLADLRAELTPAPNAPPESAAARPGRLHPGIPFAVHSTAGESLDMSVAGQTRDGAAFRPADPDLAGYVVLDFDALDQWYEEDEPIHSHPRDPYHRVDARASSRHIRIEDGGQLIAETARALLVFETSLPTRYYMPREDIVATLHPSDKTTYCPYKGEATYWSTDGRPDIAWTYRQPLPDATQLTGLLAFYDDRFDVTIDGVRQRQPASPMAKMLLEEFGV